ncbi:SAM-dependent methyltransferase [Clostridia bacterium]|nr:SAM-dependent methyltransferase [Clostridia bacterium]
MKSELKNRTGSKIKGYELLDASSGERLERWGNAILIRPDPQVIWQTPKDRNLWNNVDARYIKSQTGGGAWQVQSNKNLSQIVKYQTLKFITKPMNFKHMGLFPEQEVNWERIDKVIKTAGRPVNLLNLFGYTGAASLVAAKAGAKVCHVDAAKGMVNWGKENAKLSGIEHLLIRWIVDDCTKFVRRELKRGSKYDIIMLDPPSYGKSTGNEFWHLEEDIYPLLELLKELLSENFLMLIFNLYTTGFGIGVARYLLQSTIGSKFECKVDVEEIGLKVKSTGLVLPCGLTGMCVRSAERSKI